MGFKTYTCPIARQCGGCEWLAVPYPIQLRRKREWLEDLFGAELEGVDFEELVAMDEPKAYRHKAASPFAPGAKGRIYHGFYKAGSHKLVKCEACLVEEPTARKIFMTLARLCQELKISAYHEDSQRGCLRHALVRVGYASHQVMLVLVTNGQLIPKEKELVKRLLEMHPEIDTIVQNVNQRRTNAILGQYSKTLYGPGKIYDKLLGLEFEIRATSFYQTNPEQTEKLYQKAIDYLKPQLQPGAKLLDAYCGTGTIGLCAASQLSDIELIAVDQVEAAIDAAKGNARRNGLEEKSTFVCGDASQFMNKLAKAGEQLDAVLMDPPRAGSTESFIKAVAACGTNSVVYISCNPETQLRDILLFKKAGYRLERLCAVDMFPHTKHVETVALLTRTN